MAEAAVETSSSPRFYCHICDVDFLDTAHNFTCPYCCNGFIEELQENNEEAVNVDDWEDDDIDDLIMSPAPALEERRSSRNRQDGNRSGRRYAVNSRARIRPRTLTRLASSTLRPNVPFDSLMQDLIINLGVGVNWGASGNMQLFLGNPGDYAWGREGLDAIVTQLLNQMESTGPPPVSRDVIDALAVVEVSNEQADAKLQCSVCWEQFILNEKVRQLPCLHIYHEQCIRPWLELHGTCPICRQNLVNSDESNSDSNQDSEGASGGGGNNSNSRAYSALRNYFSLPLNLNDSSSSSSLE